MKRIAIVLTLTLVLANPSMSHPLGVKSEETRELQTLNERIAADPKNANLYLKRSDLQMSYLNYDDAIADATRAIALQPSGKAYFARGMASRYIGKLSQAEADFEKACLLDPNSQNAHAELGCLAANMHHHDKAAKAFAQLFKLNPGRNVERGRRAEMYLEMNRIDEAMNDIKTALKTDSDRGGKGHYLLGRIYMRQKQYAKAVEVFNVSLARNEFNAEVRKARADVYDKLGKPDLAKKDRQELDEVFSEAFKNAPFRSK
jgi:tetratricopeptide (TPR) repeat protein